MKFLILKLFLILKETTAGTANWGKNLIRFNPTLLRENPEDFLIETTGHEVAHLIAHEKFGAIDPHGKEWKNVMWAFSLPAKRCHNYNTRKNQKPNIIKTSEGLIKLNSIGRIIEFE